MSTINNLNTSKKPDGIIKTNVNSQIYITEFYFDFSSKDTFQDKLINAFRAENN